MWIAFIIVLCVLFYITEPQIGWLYTDIDGNIVFVANKYKGVITVQYIELNDKEFRKITGPQNIPYSTFKLRYIRWKKYS